MSIGGPQVAFDHFMRHLTFAEDTSKVIKSKELDDNTNRNSSKETAD